MRQFSPGFGEGIIKPVHVPDDPVPQPVPLQAYFAQEMAPASRNLSPPERCIAVQVTRRRARGPEDGSAFSGR